MLTLWQRLQRKAYKVSRRVTNQMHHREYPEALDVKGPNLTTVEFFKSTGSLFYAEIGVYQGDTASLIAQHLNGEGHLYLFDWHDRVGAVEKRLASEGYHNVTPYGNSRQTMDSYNWTLGWLLGHRYLPDLDYVFLDGAHTWFIDGFTFLLCDRLLKVGGYIDFDDYEWSLATSGTQRPDILPITAHWYTPQQIEAQQVKMVVDLLVKTDARYKECVPNKIYQKMS